MPVTESRDVHSRARMQGGQAAQGATAEAGAASRGRSNVDTGHQGGKRERINMPLAEAEGMSTATCLSYPYPRAQDMLTPTVGAPRIRSPGEWVPQFEDVGRLRAEDPVKSSQLSSASVH